MSRLLRAFVALSILVAPVRSFASAAAPTPTFVLSWGSFGSAPGLFNAPLAATTDAVGNVYVVDTNNSRVQEFNRLGNLIAQWGSFGSAPGQFNQPAGIAVDPSGNVFVSDAGNNRIQKFTAGGAYWVLQWGSGGAGNGQFSVPVGVAADRSGNIYVVDQANNRVQKFDGVGNFITKWGAAGTGTGQFSAPFDIAADAAGHVFVADQLNNRIQKFSNTGAYISQWGTAGSGNGQFTTPTGVAVDAVGNVYVTDYGNNRMQKFDVSGTYIGQWGGPGSGDGLFYAPVAVALDPAMNLYIVDRLNYRIQKFSGVGAVLAEVPDRGMLEWGGFGPGSGMFETPMGVAAPFTGYVYVVDAGLNSVQRFRPSGTFLDQWGSLGSGDGQFTYPVAICADQFGYVYVTDYYNDRIQKFDGVGNFITKWGSFGTGSGQFNGPQGVAADFFGNVFVVDQLNHRVQKFSSSGTYLTQWGSNGIGNGQFQYPVGVAVDAIGNVYVTDNGNNRIQKFTNSGAYILQWGTAGSFPGQFNSPYGIAVDAAGNVCVADQYNHRLQKFTSNGTYLSGSYGIGGGLLGSPLGLAADAAGNIYLADAGRYVVTKFETPPSVSPVSDVVNDQGRQAQIRFTRCSADDYGSGVTVTGYEIYRRIDPVPSAAHSRRAPDEAGSAGIKDASPTPEHAELAGWTYLMTAPAHGESEYNVVVPTLADATPSLLEYTTFMVRAATSNPLTFFDSAVEYGVSIDNLAPASPSPFTGAYVAGATHLHWGPNHESDFGTYRLYRGATSTFGPSPANLIATSPDTGYADPGPPGSWYKLSAVDVNGNESVFAVVGPNQTLDTPAVEARVEFALDGVRPNPSFGDRFTIEFALPSSEPATLEVIDVAGRRVAGRTVGSLGPGRHTIDLARGQRLAAGVYLVRLSQGAERRIVRAIVL
ncbi:MAG TPA: 6-bladed beta-propeller [Candidatus Udaeobacter sp.]|jgi:DNA-binding beta-propeller fold protein YncE|nr:6-bladed beta-propeller [Candidatus Udaeobacter sp.]